MSFFKILVSRKLCILTACVKVRTMAEISYKAKVASKSLTSFFDEEEDEE